MHLKVVSWTYSPTAQATHYIYPFVAASFPSGQLSGTLDGKGQYLGLVHSVHVVAISSLYQPATQGLKVGD